MKYFISKKFFSAFWYEVTDKNYIRQIEKHDNLKTGDSIIILDSGIDYNLKLKKIENDELYFEY